MTTVKYSMNAQYVLISTQIFIITINYYNNINNRK